jgi:hypothetical protein
MAYLIVDSSVQGADGLRLQKQHLSRPCSVAIAENVSSSLFSTDSHLTFFIFITIHYISLHFPGLFFSEIAEFFKNSRVVGGLASPSSEDSTKNLRESGQKMAKFESNLRVRSSAGNATA